MKSIERRLRNLEAAKTPAGRKIRSLLDLVKWAGDGGGEEPDLSECPKELVELIYSACGEAQNEHYDT